jgi:prostaglandin-H2 D-isomerase / glutathione transferase
MKLVYFNLRGVVEVSRYMLHMGGAEYEDFRYPFDTSNWAKPEADAAKIEGKHDINMGRLPFLEVDGQLVAQSKSIERFVATRFGFYGANDVEAAQIDCVCEHVRDIKDAYQKVRGIQDKAEKKAGMEKWFGTDLPEWCGKLEKSLKITSTTRGVAVGSKVSLADITIYYWLTFFFDNVEGAKAAHSTCPTISAIVETTGALEKVKEWEATRPDTKM